MVANNECDVNNAHVLDTTTDNVDNNRNEQCEWMAPGAQGLYDPQNEHEACGVGFIVAIDGKPSHKVRIISTCIYISISSVYERRECASAVHRQACAHRCSYEIRHRIPGFIYIFLWNYRRMNCAICESDECNVVCMRLDNTLVFFFIIYN